MPNMEENKEHILPDEAQDTPAVVPEESIIEEKAEIPAEPPVAPASDEPLTAPAEEKTELPAEEKTETPTEEKAQTPSEEKKAAPAAPYYARYEAEEKKDEAEDAKRARNARIRNAVLAVVLAVSLLSVTLLGGFALGKMNIPPAIGGSTTTNQGGGASQPPINRGDLILNVVERVEGTPAPGSVAGLVATVGASVVEIETVSTAVDPYEGEYDLSGAGSGVLINAGNAKGLILTCNHVVDGADAGGITVTLSDGRSFSGLQVEVLGTDSWSDLALLRIRERNGEEPKNLTYATLATSGTANDYSYMSVGEGVVAIGNPLGTFGGSVTSGIISALGREVTVDGTPMTLMQTDAAVNPGNSGGGLFNMAGELIGIVNAKSTGDAVEGIGFAIPSSDAIPLVGELYSQGYVSGRPFLGLYFKSVSGYFTVVSYDYNDNLPFGKALQAGDYLTHVEGEKITSTSTIRAVLAEKEIGDYVTFTVARLSGRSRQTFEVSLRVYEYTP